MLTRAEGTASSTAAPLAPGGPGPYADLVRGANPLSDGGRGPGWWPGLALAFVGALTVRLGWVFGVTSQGGKHVEHFHPPSHSRAAGYKGEFKFNGHNCDPEPYAKELDRVLRRTRWNELVSRLARNVRLLAVENTLWPEKGEAKAPWRVAILTGSTALASYVFVPLTLLGAAWSGLRRRPGAVVTVTMLVGLVATSAFFGGELRYRVPYDPLFLGLAVQAVREVPLLGGQERWPRAWRAVGLVVALVTLWIPWR